MATWISSCLLNGMLPARKFNVKNIHKRMKKRTEYALLTSFVAGRHEREHLLLCGLPCCCDALLCEFDRQESYLLVILDKEMKHGNKFALGKTKKMNWGQG